MIFLFAFLESCSIFHRDIKIDNIICYRNMFKSRFAIIDFNLSTINGFKYSKLSTSEYRDPHMNTVDRVYDGRSDVWSFGVFLSKIFRDSSKVQLILDSIFVDYDHRPYFKDLFTKFGSDEPHYEKCIDMLKQVSLKRSATTRIDTAQVHVFDK